MRVLSSADRPVLDDDLLIAGNNAAALSRLPDGAVDHIFGRDAFLNELIWAYDYGAKPRRRWPAKHDTILVYVRTPGGHWFDPDAVEREPYMAPGLVSAEKAARGKRPTDVWFHTIVP